MYRIQANPSGTRSIEVGDEHLQTLKNYNLLEGQVDSNGIVDEQVLEKLKLNIRSLLESGDGKDKALLDLCLDVIYHPNMKAFGLKRLVTLFNEWEASNDSEQQPAEEA